MAPSKKDGGYSIIFPRRKAGQDSRGPTQPVIVTMELLKELSHMPLATAAEKLGVSPTAIKKACRKLGVHRWPIKPMTEARPTSSKGSEPRSSTAASRQASPPAKSNRPPSQAAPAASPASRGRPSSAVRAARAAKIQTSKAAAESWAPQPKAAASKNLSQQDADAMVQALSPKGVALSRQAVPGHLDGRGARGAQSLPEQPFEAQKIHFIPHRSAGHMPPAAAHQAQIHPAVAAWAPTRSEVVAPVPIRHHHHNADAMADVGAQPQSSCVQQGNVADPRYWHYVQSYPTHAAAHPSHQLPNARLREEHHVGSTLPGVNTMIPVSGPTQPMMWSAPYHHHHGGYHHASSASSSSSMSTIYAGGAQDSDAGASSTHHQVQPTLSRSDSRESFQTCPNYGTVSPQLSRSNSLSNLMAAEGIVNFDASQGPGAAFCEGSLEHCGAAWNLPSYLATIPSMMGGDSYSRQSSRPASRPMSRMSNSSDSDLSAGHACGESVPDASASWTLQALSRPGTSMSSNMQCVSA
mmetsp:Transcript_10616/g.21005  ORF Transcript_10616/g.21005 Transcript_10616/m.21005 type:complete len:523 (+) Transcript_10616:217-1785(+)